MAPVSASKHAIFPFTYRKLFVCVRYSIINQIKDLATYLILIFDIDLSIFLAEPELLVST